MKKRTQDNSSRKRYLLGAGILVAAALLYGIIAHSQALWPFQKVTVADKDATRHETVTNPSPKDNNIPAKSDSSGSSKTSNQIPVDQSLSATITTLNQTGDTINFAAAVTNAKKVGTCVVTFSNPNDRPVTKQFDSTFANNVANCGPVTIPATDFSYLGRWNVSFHYYADGLQATTESTLTIR